MEDTRSGFQRLQIILLVPQNVKEIEELSRDSEDAIILSQCLEANHAKNKEN